MCDTDTVDLADERCDDQCLFLIPGCFLPLAVPFFVAGGQHKRRGGAPRPPGQLCCQQRSANPSMKWTVHLFVSLVLAAGPATA